MTKQAIKITSFTLLIILVAFSFIAFTLINQQKALVKFSLESLNENFKGEIEIDDSQINLFVTFPYVSIDLIGVKFKADKLQTSPPLYQAEHIYLGFNLLQLFNGNYHLKKIKVADGYLNVVKNSDNDFNVLTAKNIIQNNSETGNQEHFNLDLKSLTIENFIFRYADESLNKEVVAKISSLSAKVSVSKGHFFIDIISDINLDIDKDSTNTFFADKEVALDVELDYNAEQKFFNIKPSKIKLQDANFSFSGTYDLKLDKEIDLAFYGEKPDFSVFAAFAPNEVGEAIKSYENEGDIYFKGTIAGKTGLGYSPLIHVDFGCENAYFLNKNANKKVDKLEFVGSYTNGVHRNLNTSELILKNFYAKPEEGSFAGTLLIRDFADPYIKVNINADIDLEFLGKFFNIKDLRSIKGQVLLDMDFDELVDINVPSQNLAKLKEGIDSELTIRNLSFQLPDTNHMVTNAYGHAIMKAGVIQLDSLVFTIDESDFKFNGSLTDFPAVFHGFNKPIKATLNANSKKIDLARLLNIEKHDTSILNDEISDFNIKMAFTTTADQLTNFKYLPKGEFFVEDFYAKFNNYRHTFHDFHVDLFITENDFELIDFTGEIDQSDFQFNGVLNNYSKWFQDIKRGKTELTFDLNSNYLHPSDLLTYNGINYLPEEYQKEEIQNLKLRGKIDLNYDTIFKSADLKLDFLTAKLNIHPLTLNDFKGGFHFEGGHLSTQSFQGMMGASNFMVDMHYYTGTDSTVKTSDNYFHLSSTYLDIDELITYNKDAAENKNHEEAFNIFALPFTDMQFSADIHHMNYHKIKLDSIYGNGKITKDHYMYLDTLSFLSAGGSLSIKGYFNGSDPNHIYFNSKMIANQLDIDQLLMKFETAGEDHYINEKLHGRISGTINSKFLVYPDLTPILEESEAKLDLIVFDGSLVNFGPLNSLSDYFQDKNLSKVRFDTLQNVFELKAGKLIIPKMNINSSLGFIELSGSQGLDLSMDYFIRIPLNLVTQVGFKSLFKGKNSEDIDPDQEDAIIYRSDEKHTKFININLKGTPENYDVSLKRKKEVNP